MKIISALILLICSFSCVHEYELKPIAPNFIFHQNSSKVWLINHLYQGNKDFAPLSIAFKEILIFHKSGMCYFYKVHLFGDQNGKKATFETDGKLNEIAFQFKNKKWKFKIHSYSIDKIILKPIVAKDFNYTVELISFPEF